MTRFMRRVMLSARPHPCNAHAPELAEPHVQNGRTWVLQATQRHQIRARSPAACADECGLLLCPGPNIHLFTDVVPRDWCTGACWVVGGNSVAIVGPDLANAGPDSTAFGPNSAKSHLQSTSGLDSTKVGQIPTAFGWIQTDFGQMLTEESPDEANP